MDYLTSLVTEHGSWFGVAAAFVLAFERLARLTPTRTDDVALAIFRKFFAVLGVAVPDNPGTLPGKKESRLGGKTVLIVLLGVGLSACVGAVPWNPQNNAGLTNVAVEWCEIGEGEKARYEICELSWVDGKEKQSVSLDADMKAGQFKYSAGAVAAFAAFQSRADVETYVAEKFTEAAPEIRGGLVDVITKLAGL